MKCKAEKSLQNKKWYIKKYWPGRGYIIPKDWNEFKITTNYKYLFFDTEEQAKTFITEKGWTKLPGWNNVN